MRWILAAMLVLSSFFSISASAAAETQPFVIINKAVNQLALIDNGKIETVYPVATGVNTLLTPEGMFTVTVKAKNPYYRKKISREARRTIRLERGGLDLTRKERTDAFTGFTERIIPHPSENMYRKDVCACTITMSSSCMKKFRLARKW